MQTRTLGTETTGRVEVSAIGLPIPGSSRPETITDSARAADLTLTDEELARLG